MDVEVTPQKIVLACLAGSDQDTGNLKVTMTTTKLTDDNSFVITHERATTDRRTVVNLTHHSFFNLRGGRVFDKRP